ncbi:MAG: hypothetical protein ABI288_02600 [Ginsengibacter sp.]
MKTVIVFADLHPEVLKYIKKVNKNVRIIYWYWDPVFRLGPPKKWIYKIAEMWSFDPDNCLKYGFKFNRTFYFRNIHLRKTATEYDVVFVGNDKGRIEYLQTLQNVFSKLRINGYYHIIPEKQNRDKIQYQEIPYVDYLNLIAKSKALIDVKPLGQSGLTIRVMESIFFKKKLITNDNSIINQDFYCSDNIFIQGMDREDQLIEFINSPYIELEAKIVERYDVKSWLERFNI